MPQIGLHDISANICQDVNLTVQDREFFVLLGPNGAGKTTLLTVIAGLIKYKGSVTFDGSPIDKLPPEDRGVSYLPQHLILFPHLTVKENVAYGLRARGVPRPEVDRRSAELLHLVRLEALANRHPRHLSGGERQRVALARALASNPKVLLLDEPLASLDLQTAKRLRREIRQLHELTGITTLYVTHNLEEAEELGDRVAFFDAGRVEQVGPPRHVYFHPESDRVASFIGAPNILSCEECRPLGHGVAEVVSGDLTLIVPHDGATIRKVAFLPGDLYLSKERPPGPDINRFLGRVTEIRPLQSLVQIKVSCAGHELLAEMSLSAFEELAVEEQQDVYVIVKLRRIRTYEE